MTRLKRFVKSLTTILQAVKYQKELDGEQTAPSRKVDSRLDSNNHRALARKLSASDGNIDKLGVTQATYKNHGNVHAKHDSVRSFHSKSVSDVSKLVAHVIEEASLTAARTVQGSMMYREPIRVINGQNPSIQSQVLLNTKTSQPFEDLVKDLAMAVQTRGQPIGDCLKTLTGRQIKSYSQLRSELKAGQRAFFIYREPPKVIAARSNNPPPGYENGRPIVKASLGGITSSSLSEPSSYESRRVSRQNPNYTNLRSQSPVPQNRGR